MTENQIVLSIETHLFFARIMKEHALFLMAGFPCKEEAWIQKADWYRQQFESLLGEAAGIGDGAVSCCILDSGELTTEFTVPAEKRTSCLTGIPINTALTLEEKKLTGASGRQNVRALSRMVEHMNEWAVSLLKGLIAFKESILQEVERGALFTSNYPLLIRHIIREAELYCCTVEELMRNPRITYENLWGTEQFWNQIMMEHALFIRGLLDPSEEALICTANDFAMDYEKLLDLAEQREYRAAGLVREKSLEETLKYRDFKAAGTEEILDCRIASIILPLLADHVLREANHYLRILECRAVGREG